MLFDFLQTDHALRDSLQTQVGQPRPKVAVFLLRPGSLIFPSCPALVRFVEILVSVSPGPAVTDLTLAGPTPVFLTESHLMEVLLLPPIAGGRGVAVPGIVLVLSLSRMV